MIELLLIVIVVIIICFAAVCFLGSPYVPTRKRWANEALALVELTDNDVVIDLGAGDGKILQILSQKKVKSIGYEINPFLVAFAKIRLARTDYVKIKMKNYWKINLPQEATVVYAFMVERDAGKLEEYVCRQTKNVKSRSLKLITFGFMLPKKKPIKQHNGSFLYLFE